MKRFLVFFFICYSKLFAQEMDVLDKSILNISVNNLNNIGLFKDKIASDFVGNGSLGFSVSYFRNPLYNTSSVGQLYLGLGLGFVNKRQDVFSKTLPQGSFYVAHNQTNVDFLMRYKPKAYGSKFMPYAEIFAGPKCYNSKFMEVLDDENLDNLKGFTDWTLHYGLNTGVGMKISKSNRPSNYLEFGIGYSQENAVKIVNRNSLGLDNSYTVLGNQMVFKPQYLTVKIGLTSYL